MSDYKCLKKFNVADDMLYVCLWYGKGSCDSHVTRVCTLLTANFGSNSIEFSNRSNTSSILLSWDNIKQKDRHTDTQIKISQTQIKDLLISAIHIITFTCTFTSKWLINEILDIQVDLRPCGGHVLP